MRTLTSLNTPPSSILLDPHSSTKNGRSASALPGFSPRHLLLPSPASQQSSRDRRNRPREAVSCHSVNTERVRDKNEKKSAQGQKNKIRKRENHHKQPAGNRMSKLSTRDQIKPPSLQQETAAWIFQEGKNNKNVDKNNATRVS